jgi:SsrA-binding protein
MPRARGTKLIASNRKAYHEYFVIEKFEAGISLSGTEVKSIRAGRVNLKDCYAAVSSNELFVYGMHVSPYEHGNIYNRDPDRPRKLLMHRREILNLFSAVSRKGYALIPLSLYFRDSRVKVELGLCKGKKLYDKREALAQKQEERDSERYFKDGSGM